MYHNEPAHLAQPPLSRSPSPEAYPVSPLVPANGHHAAAADAKSPIIRDAALTDLPSPSEKQLPRRSSSLSAGRRYVANGWLVEIVACASSCLFLLGLIVFLHSVDVKPLQQVMFGLFPNTVVSILSTAVKATLLLPIGECISQLKWVHARHTRQPLYSIQQYDSASRGPLGALKFLFKAPSTLHTIAYVCCVVTLLSLALDPFSQQILYYQPGAVMQPGLASSMPISHIYNLGMEGIQGVSANIGQRDLDMQAAIVSGLFGHAGEMPYTCPGNECQFPPSSGLAVVGACQDVTRSLKKTCYHPDISSGSSNWHNASTQACDFQFPNNGSILSAAVMFDAHSGTVHTNLNMTATRADPSCNPQYKQCPLDNLVVASILRFPNTNNSMSPISTAWLDSMDAHTCTLDIRASGNLGARIVNGTLQLDNATFAPLVHIGATSVPVGPMLADFAVQDSTVRWPHAGNYSVGLYDLDNIASLLSSLFGKKYGSAATSTTGPAEALLSSALVHTQDLNHLFGQMGQSMSIRMATGPNSTTVAGSVLSDQTIVHVQWAWLSLTFIILVVVIVVLVATIVESRRHAGDTVWKSSVLPLAVIPQTLPGGDANAPASKWRLSDLEARAKHLDVEMEVRGHDMTWRLS